MRVRAPVLLAFSFFLPEKNKGATEETQKSSSPSILLASPNTVFFVPPCCGGVRRQ